MTTTFGSDTTNDDLSKIPDSHLLVQYANAREVVTIAQVRAGYVEQEIWRRMGDRGDKAIADNTYVCEQVETPVYLQEAFAPLKELLVEADLKKVLTPAHDEPVPDKWATAKVLAFGRRYPQVQAVVDKARQPGHRKLKFERRS